MAAELTLYTNPMSRGRIARWMLEEVGEAYDTVVLDYGKPMRTAEYLAINPMGKVPALRHGPRVITECAAICAYLADAFPDAGLAPPPAQRADYYRWLFFAAGPLEAAVVNHSAGWDPAGEMQGRFGYGSFDRTVSALEDWLRFHPYVADGRFTAADVYVGAQVIWGTGFGSMPARPAFEAYRDRLIARPAYARAKAMDDALMPPPDAGS